MRRGLDTERILSRLKVLPFIHAWELVFGHVQFESKAKPSIHHSNRHASVAIRSHIVLPNLFVEVVSGASGNDLSPVIQFQNGRLGDAKLSRRLFR